MKNINTKQNKYRKVVRQYFFDFFQTLVVFDALIIIGFIFASELNPWNNWNLIMPVMILLFPLFSIKMIVFYIQVIKDIKCENIHTETIIIKEITYDKEHNLFNRGGALIGIIKYNLLTTNEENFTFCTRVTNVFESVQKEAEITYTINTKMLLSLCVDQKVILLSKKPKVHCINH